MIEVRQLGKRFGGQLVLRQVNLDVATGERVAVIGPNGAGKTTLLRILATLTRPSEGSVRLDGLDLVGAAGEVRRRIGFLSHQPLLYDHLSAEENLRFYGQMYGLRDAEERIAGLLATVGLTSRRRDRVGTYSRGMKQRLAIARTLLHGPDVLLLDEPYAGLDPAAEEMLDGLLREEGRTVLLSTHQPEQGLRLGGRVVILQAGQVRGEIQAEGWEAERLRAAYRQWTEGEG